MFGVILLKGIYSVYWRLLLCYIILHEAHCSRKGWSVSFTGEGLPRESKLLAYTGLLNIYCSTKV